LSLLHFAVLAPFLFAIIVPALYKLIRRVHTGWFVLGIPIVLFAYFIRFLPLDPAAGPIVHTIPWISQLDIHFTVYVDGLSLLLALIITGVGSLVVLYSIFYMSRREALHNFYVYLLCFMGAMLGVVLSDNLLVLYTFWEITSFSSFLLIAYWYQRKNSRYGATKSLLITIFGGFAMLLGFIMLFVATGTLSVREMISQAATLADHPLFVPAMLLVLLGAMTKSAQFPFHIWLPDAMEAPTPISAYLHSATMVKAGVFLVARLTPVFGGHMLWFWLITIFAIITLFWGSFMAIKQFDLKAMLAYSTISQLGLIMSLLGIGSLALHPDYMHIDLFAAAVLAAIFHLINHSIFKGCLFMVIGILDHELGTRDIRKLGGLMGFMPISFTITLIGAFSMAGLPPFSGFLSKEMFFTGVLTAADHIGGWVTLIPIIAWVASILTFVYCMILVFKTFTGKHKPELLDKKPDEASIGMLISPAILASLVIVLFFFPNILSGSILEPALLAVLPTVSADVLHIQAWHGWNMELFMTIGVVLLGTLLFLGLSRWVRVFDYLPQTYTLNYAFNQGLSGMERISSRITGGYMTGFTRDYLTYIFAFLIVMTGWSLWSQEAFVWDMSTNAHIYLYEYVIGIALAVSAIFIVFSTTRLNAIIALSIVGFLMSLLFINFRAPDLALTQLVVETISTALFLLCFYFLPKLRKELTRIPLRISNLIISVGVGLTLTLIGLSTQGHRLFQPIAEYYEQAEALTGARNIVNAILVDFRGFDTMLEIVVLFMAGIGVFTLVKLRRSRRNDA